VRSPQQCKAANLAASSFEPMLAGPIHCRYSSYTERRSFGSDSRNCVGERPTIRLNARLKFVMD
jgi:hypothetical protein